MLMIIMIICNHDFEIDFLLMLINLRKEKKSLREKKVNKNNKIKWAYSLKSFAISGRRIVFYSQLRSL